MVLEPLCFCIWVHAAGHADMDVNLFLAQPMWPNHRIPDVGICLSLHVVRTADYALVHANLLMSTDQYLTH